MLYPTELRADATVKQVVGVKRFELPTSCSQSRRATGLRYTPRESRIIRKLSTLANFFVKKNWISVRELLRQRLSVSETGKNFGESADGVRLPDTIFPH